MKHKKRLSFSIKFTVVICSLLLVINAVLGVVLLSQSGNSMETLIRNHMTAVSSTAASLIDGDVLASFTEEDVGTEAYQKISDLLITVKNVQKDADIKYIYIIKKVDEGFVFIVDPDPENPADFGEEIVYTPEQEKAWEGTPQVDAEATEDEWGCYYSAWSPITDSSGKVVAIVGMDFAADWYNSQVASHTRSVVLISCLSLLAGGTVMLILSS
ncbi:MAG: hypothetical protein J5793_01105, partial [Clostridia bacterium]|nr:hypothetical protein [Clostridia bacterium]